MLKAPDIISAAEHRVGISDPEMHLHPALDALTASLNGDNRLSAQGEAAARRSILARTTDRLEGLKWIAEFPEIAQEQVEAPLFLTGLPRSGTTYFQYLFDRDRRFRSVRTWEALMPNPPPGHDAASVIRRKAQEAQMRRDMRPAEVEGFDALHLIDEDGSEECHAFMEQSYAAAGFFNLYDAPSYLDFLTNRLDMTAAYAVHRRQLQLLQWRSRRGRWVLKYPNHVMAMDAILAIYPDARFAMTHRDPVQIVASIARMTLALRSTRYDPPFDPFRAGRQMLDFVRRHVDRIMAFCTGPHADRVIHVDYYALVADPLHELEAVHAALGLDTPEDVREAIGGWRRANPKNGRGANEYALEQFGIDRDVAEELFADYRRHFDIAHEQKALAALRKTA